MRNGCKVLRQFASVERRLKSHVTPSLAIWKLIYYNGEGDRGCDQCCRYISFQIFANKEIGGNSTKTINANKDSAREAPAIPLKIMIQREHLVRVLIHVI